MKKDKEKYVAVIDHDVLREVFEYLLKTKLPSKKFEVIKVRESKELGFIADIRDVDEKGFYLDELSIMYPKYIGDHSTGERLSVISELKGRGSKEMNPTDSFKLSRKIGKIMEQKIDEEMANVFEGSDCKVSVKGVEKRTRKAVPKKKDFDLVNEETIPIPPKYIKRHEEEIFGMSSNDKFFVGIASENILTGDIVCRDNKTGLLKRPKS
jgi:hypothetical protein